MIPETEENTEDDTKWTTVTSKKQRLNWRKMSIREQLMNPEVGLTDSEGSDTSDGNFEKQHILFISFYCITLFFI